MEKQVYTHDFFKSYPSGYMLSIDKEKTEWNILFEDEKGVWRFRNNHGNTLIFNNDYDAAYKYFDENRINKFEHKFLFKAIVGSQSSGCATPDSDIDVKAVYMQTIDELITFNYIPQIDITKDETYWEVQRFLQLLQSANPSVLELLYSPEDCILETTPQFELLRKNRDKFLTKKCKHSFGGYVRSQLHKASGLDKKMNWEKERIERKEIFDFIYYEENGKTYNINKLFDYDGVDGRNPYRCGLVALDHMKDYYALYYDENNECGFRGLISEGSNQLRLSSIPKGLKPIVNIYFNHEHYSKHCKEYKEYTEWLGKRNTSRYVDNVGHGQMIDSKNLLHCRRLLDICVEIASTNTFNVRRPNVEYLLSIKKGKVSLPIIIEEANNDLSKIDELFEKSNLPEDCSKEFVDELLLKIRKM